MTNSDAIAPTAVCKEVARFYADAARLNADAAERVLTDIGVLTRGFGPVTHWLVLAAAPSTADALDAVNRLRQIIDAATPRPTGEARGLSLDELGELMWRKSAA